MIYILVILYILTGVLLDIQNNDLIGKDDINIDIMAVIFWPIVVIYQLVLLVITLFKGGK